jgi:hypothetical protein
MTPRREITLFSSLTAVVTLVLVFFVIFIFSVINGPSIPAERLTSAANAIIQLDSFLVAGYVVGIFYFLERLERERQQWLGALQKRFIAILIPATVVSFVLSGLIATLGILIAWYQDLELAVILLLYGLWLVFATWFVLQSTLEYAKKIRVVKD